MRELTIDAVVANLEKVNEFIKNELTGIEFSKRFMMQLELVVEEIFVNIASYSYPGKTGSVTIQIEVEKNPPAVTLVFKDQGIEYNPLAQEAPDVDLALEDRNIGGLGIFLVKNYVDDLSYSYNDGSNVLTLKKIPQ